eukprot:3305580-Pyramimonas_sp.AAC.1
MRRDSAWGRRARRGGGVRRLRFWRCFGGQLCGAMQGRSDAGLFDGPRSDGRRKRFDPAGPDLILCHLESNDARGHGAPGSSGHRATTRRSASSASAEFKNWNVSFTSARDGCAPATWPRRSASKAEGSGIRRSRARAVLPSLAANVSNIN